MKETTVEDYFCDEVLRAGGRTVKMEPKNAVGIPDRLVIMPKFFGLVELKRPKKGVLRGAQSWWRDFLLGFGHNWRRINTKTQVDEFIKEFS